MSKNLPDPSKRSFLTRLTKSFLEIARELSRVAEEWQTTDKTPTASTVNLVPSPQEAQAAVVNALQRLPVAHLIYLLTFDKPRALDAPIPFPSPPSYPSWEACLGAHPTVVASQLQEIGALVRADVRVHLDQTFTRVELQTLLSTRQLPISGNKDELIERLVQADETGMWAVVADLTLWEYTPLAWYTAKTYLEKVMMAAHEGETATESAAQPDPMRNAIQWILAAAAVGVIGNRVDAVVMALVDSIRAGNIHAETMPPILNPPDSPLLTSPIATPSPEPLPHPQAQPSCHPNSTPIPRLGFDWVTISAGEFVMGSDKAQDKAAYDDELPQHRLYLPEYRIARVAVTNAQYQQFVAAKGYTKPSHWEKGEIPKGKANHPVVNVSWQDAIAFCEWAGVRLPSEAEWEKAARGTDGRLWPWGNEVPDKERCNFGMNVGDTTAVGTYPKGASPYGCLDMAGNVWEWTRSLFKGYPYKPDDGREDSADAGTRVVRGGSFVDFDRYVRCAFRVRHNPGFRYFIGFRVMSPGS